MFHYNYYKALAKTYGKILLKKEKSTDRSYLDLGIINPSIGTSNLGDLIIYEAVISSLREKYPNELFTDFPSQIDTSFDAKRLMYNKDYLFISGTNLLTSNMNERNQWKVGPEHKLFIRNKVLLVGVGWWQYQNKPNRYTKSLYQTVFNDTYMHSVRDSYTLNMLNEIGINNVINTSCPTLWNITQDLCDSIPKKKAPNVITTLTFYKAAPDLDRKLLTILLDNYEKVYLWVQGLDDVAYLNQIMPNANRIHLISPSLDAYNRILEDPSVEYLGTRLHAGIRAIQKGVRTLIVAVDNRAVEIGNDVNLNVIKRENLDEILNFINFPYKTQINLPLENIQRWKNSLPMRIK